MFRLYKYNEHEFYGLMISKNKINLGKKEKINSYKYITVDDIKDYNDCFCIAFDEFFNEGTMNIILDLFNNEFSSNKHNTIEEIIDSISDYFSIIRKDNFLREYIGLLSELFFILWAHNNGYDIVSNYQEAENDVYDFSFANNKIEIKTIDKNKKSISLSAR